VVLRAQYGLFWKRDLRVPRSIDDPVCAQHERGGDVHKDTVNTHCGSL
jgi:hypothetical protein